MTDPIHRKTAIVGASGVVGRALLERLTSSGEQVIGLSRNPPADLADVNFSALDLMDVGACKRAAADQLRDVTHLVYTALYEKPGLIAGWREADQMQTNLTMLQNLLSQLSEAPIRQVTLLQGTKAYGAHIAPMRIPGLERAPRHPHDNFYWLQQDYLEDMCEQQGWHFTIWRPQIIFGHAAGAPMNLLAAIGAYAALQQHSGLPLHYPGGPSGVMEAIDANLLAEAIHFSFDNEPFQNEIFNITNGDVFKFEDLWPALAECFGMETGEPVRQHFSEHCYDLESDWQSIVSRHELRPNTLRGLVGDSFYYADALLNTYGDQTPPPALVSTIKLRQAGFNSCIDTEVMFQQWFDEMRRLKVLPPISRG